ncbi:Uma2 family endonuclease [Nocardia sp. NPDC058658]|uniref:Uma2 family endonuclease n=1 Tax=Nocardia sp. NPDC058658 TaxID=3346580 RepID=UPI0036469313
MAMPVPHHDYWTAADLDDLPEDGLRYEVLNGQLVVNAAPKPRHQLLIQRLVRVLVDAAPVDSLVLDGVGVVIGDDEPIPDAMVATGAVDLDARGVPVAQVDLVVEVVSKSTAMTDRVVKPIMYSTAGIASYWRFEINPFAGQFPGEGLPVLFAYRLGPDGGYEQTHRVAAGDTADLRTPFPVTITPASLLP